MYQVNPVQHIHHNIMTPSGELSLCAHSPPGQLQLSHQGFSEQLLTPGHLQALCSLCCSPPSACLYASLIQHILLYCPRCFYMLSTTNKSRLAKKSQIINRPTPNFSEINHRAVTGLTRTVATPPNPHFPLLPSGCRCWTLRWRRAGLRKRFIPTATAALNDLPHQPSVL